jgi:hypothetical protein
VQTRAAVRAQEPRDNDHVTLSTSEPSAYQRLREHLAYLEMSAAAEHLADELDRACARRPQPPRCWSACSLRSAFDQIEARNRLPSGNAESEG